MPSLLKRFNWSDNLFLYGSIFFSVIFIFSRLFYFIYYPVTVLSSDSASYCAVALDILNSDLPLFDIRTPAYPVFLFLIWSVSKSFFAVALVQSLVTFFTGIIFLYIIDRTYKKMTFVFALSLSIYISSSYFLLLEKSILTEGIFVNFLLLNAGLMILAMKDKRNLYWVLYSVSVALLIFIRPAALFLFGIVFIIAVYFLINKYTIRYYVSLVLPAVLLILILCSYNYFTLKLFTITPFGEANLSGVTILFMQPSENYSTTVNEAIKNTTDSIPRKDISYVKNSWGFSKLYHIFNENFYRQVNFTENLMRIDTTLSFTDIQPVMREVSADAIKNYPVVYYKFILSNFLFFFNNMRISMEYNSQLKGVYSRIVSDNKFTNELESGRWRMISSDRTDNMKVAQLYRTEIEKLKQEENIYINDNNSVEFKDTYYLYAYDTFEKIYNFLFRNILWLILYGVVFILSLYRLAKSMFKNEDAMAAFLLCVIFLSKAVLVSLVEVSLARYSYTVEFVIYFSLPFLFILSKNSKQLITQENK